MLPKDRGGKKKPKKATKNEQQQKTRLTLPKIVLKLLPTKSTAAAEVQ